MEIVSLPDIKKTLKKRLAMGLNYGIQALEQVILEESDQFNQLIYLQSQFNDLNRMASQRLLDYAQVEIGNNNLRDSLLALINALEVKDVVDSQEMRKPVNNELQYRKANFFELLRLHYNNLETIEVKLGGEDHIDDRVGREAVAFLYDEMFVWRYRKQKEKGEQPDRQAYAYQFFEKDYPRLEVYMKNLAFILAYILEEEVEQDFFLGVLRSNLSSREQMMLLYYGLSGIDEDLMEQLRLSRLLKITEPKRLLEAEDQL
ncbi:MAG: putative phage abortive infection protein [Bacteroidota bacterium]